MENIHDVIMQDYVAKLIEDAKDMKRINALVDFREYPLGITELAEVLKLEPHKYIKQFEEGINNAP